MKMLMLILVAFLTSWASLAFAADGEVRGKTQTIDFTGDTVDGTARRPDASYINQKRKIDFVPLYKVREKFDENIKNSVDYLR